MSTPPTVVPACASAPALTPASTLTLESVISAPAWASASALAPTSSLPTLAFFDTSTSSLAMLSPTVSFYK